MNKTIGLLLVIYSLLLAGLSYLVHHLAAGAARPTLIAGLVGGATKEGDGQSQPSGQRPTPATLGHQSRQFGRQR
jgi:hypothetical protein